MDCEDPQKRLAAYRMARREGGVSPADLFFNRSLKVPGLPRLAQSYIDEPALVGESVRVRKARAKQVLNEQKLLLYSDRAPLREGQKILVKNRKTQLFTDIGWVVKVRDSGRSAHIRLEESGNVVLLNRRCVRPHPEDEMNCAILNGQDLEVAVNLISREPFQKEGLQKSKRVRFSLDCLHRGRELQSKQSLCDSWVAVPGSVTMCCCAGEQAKHTFCADAFWGKEE